MIEEKESVVPLVHFESGDEWKEVLQLSQPHLDGRGITRLRPVLGADLKTVAVEKHYIDKDYRDTFSYYHSKRFRTPDSRCIRLHFFSEKFSKAELHESGRGQEAYLGYSVIRPTRPNCVGRTLLRPPSRLLKDAHIRLCSEKVNFQGLDLAVEGFPFVSQDADVTVCAQSALWATLRYFSNRYERYGEIHPYQIGALTTDYSIGRLFPSEGLTVWQMAEALRQRRFEPLIYSRNRHGGEKFEHLLYTYIESGIPCLVGFEDHVVCGFGHRSELDASLIPNDGNPHFSSKFNQGLVVCDDNCFPYQSLNRNGKVDAMDSNYRFSDIQTFIAPLPDKVFLAAEGFEEHVQEVATKFFTPKPPLDQTLVYRLFLTTGGSFKRSLAHRGMGHPLVQRLYREVPLPHFIWVCEISTPEDYTTGKIWGEILWDATFNPHEIEGLIAFHLQDSLLLDVGGPLNRPQVLKKLDLRDGKAYDLYVSNLKNLN